MSGRVYARVLCEGLQDAVFARRLLYGLGVGPREIFVQTNPSGQGAGEKFVRDRYPLELADHRVARAKRRAILLVLTDADVRSVADTRQQLTHAVHGHGLSVPGTADLVTILVPRRNIETWLHALEGERVDETTVYPKRRNREADCQRAVDRLLDLLLDVDATVEPPSLAEAVVDLRRLTAWIKA